MKHTTPDLMKFKRLQRRLGLPLYAAIGVLEGLWIATQKNAPRGDVGRFDDESIAIEIGWEGDPDELVRALVETGWLDECQDHRLVVHDWPDHAPRWVHGVATRTGGFVSATVAANDSSQLQSATIVANSRARASPNLTKPNLKSASALSSARADGSVDCRGKDSCGNADDPELLDWCQWWNRLRAEGLVAASVSTAPVSQAVLRAWRRAKRDREVREAMTQRETLEEAIRSATFVHGSGWFTLVKLLGGKNREGELVIVKLLNGGYLERSPSARRMECATPTVPEYGDIPE